MPFIIHANKRHRHPLQMIRVLINAGTLVIPFQKIRRPAITKTNVTGIGRGANGIRPNDHAAKVLRCCIATSKFQ